VSSHPGLDDRLVDLLERSLRVRYPVSLSASGCGRFYSTITRSPGGSSLQVLSADGSLVAELQDVRNALWHDSGLIFPLGEEVFRLEPDAGKTARIGRWSDRKLLAVVGSDLWFSGHDFLARHRPDCIEVDRLQLPKRLLGLTGSDEGNRIALRLVEPGGESSLLVLASDGEAVYGLAGASWCTLAACFLDRGRLAVTRMTRDSKERQVLLVDLDRGVVSVLLEERSEKGFVRLPGAVARRGHVAYLRYVDGWPLLCLFDADSGRETVVNPGEHEDLTDVEDLPAFSPDGRRLAFNSGKGDPRQRHLFVFDLQTRELQQLSQEDGATGGKAWLGNELLVHVQATADRPAEVALRPVARGSQRAPVGDAGAATPGFQWNESSGVAPMSITIDTPTHDIPADLYLPRQLEASRRHPALVYAHGGVFRQLTRGYPPSYTYTLLHEINQVLVELGFIVLSVEYRGSTGFGLEHEQANHLACGEADVDDCASAASWLAKRGYVDSNRIGIWGISWGGTMTLHALVKHPHLFAAGVSIAGIWDFDQRARYWNGLQDGLPIYFDGRMGPLGEASPGSARWLASARNFVENLRSPLLSLHGTSDESVDYDQQTLLESDCRRHGKDLEAMTFADEAHVFERAESWRRALRAMMPFLLRHLADGSSGEE
jgi:dipeptidyl aminopeptidase/acylaminoacyl peptidase